MIFSLSLKLEANLELSINDQVKIRKEREYHAQKEDNLLIISHKVYYELICLMNLLEVLLSYL